MRQYKWNYISLVLAGFLLIKSSAEGEECISAQGKGCGLLENCIENTCVHKEIFPLTIREIIGASLIVLISGFANIGGKGGGSLLTPILFIIHNYDARKAVMLTYVLGFGGSLGNFLNVAFQKSVKTEKPVILYDFAVIAVPIMFLASSIGVLLNRMIAPILTVCLLLYMLGSGIPRIYRKAKMDYQKEVKFENSREDQEEEEMREYRNLGLMEQGKGVEWKTMDAQLVQGLQVTLEEEEKTFIPKKKMGFLMLVVAFVLFTFLLQGSHRISSIVGIEYCSFWYWFCYLINLVGCYLFYKKGISIVEGISEAKSNLLQTSQHEIIGPDNIKQIGALGFTTGFLRGLVGTSGITNPMLSLGIEAQDMAATLGLLAVLTSFLNLTQAFLYAGISISEMLFFFIVSFAGSYIISAGLYRMINSYKRPSLILFVLLGVQTLNLIIFPLYTIYEVVNGDSKMFSFHSVC